MLGRVAWVARCTSAGTGGHDVDNDTAAATQQPISTPPPAQDVVIVVIDSGGSSSIGVRVQCIDQSRWQRRKGKERCRIAMEVWFRTLGLEAALDAE